MAVWVVGVTFIAVSGVLLSLLASRYPPLWGTVLLHVGGLAASLTVIVIVSYARFVRQQLAQQVAKNATITDRETPIS